MQNMEKYFECDFGPWIAQARIQAVDNGKIMAIISTVNRHNIKAPESRHTVVFEHQPGLDSTEETRTLVRKILQDRYGYLNRLN